MAEYNTYKGKLTGAQIDALPDKVTGLETRIGNIEDNIGIGGNRIEVISPQSISIQVDSADVNIPARKRTVLTPQNNVKFQGKAFSYVKIKKYKVDNAISMFKNCMSLLSIDIENLDTSEVTSMNGMFYSCLSVNYLLLDTFDTSKVTDMSSMFNDCSKLAYVYLSNWDVSNVTDMSGMFNYCLALTSLDLSGWDVSNVTNMGNLFNYCLALTSLDLSGWDVSNVTNMGSMFNNCSALVTLTLGEQFFKCGKISSIDFSTLQNWKNDSVRQSLVTNSYDRAANGLQQLTLKLHANTKAVLTDEDKAAMTAKGYIIA